MNFFLGFITILLPLVVTSCFSTSRFSELRWSALNDPTRDGSLQNNPLPTNLQYIVENKKPDTIFKTKHETVKRFQQSFSGVPVKSAWVQTLYNNKGELVYAVANTPKNLSRSVLADLVKIKAEQESLIEKALKSNSGLKNNTKIVSVAYDLEPTLFSLRPLLKVTYLNKAKTDFIEISLDKNGWIREQKAVGFGADGVGNIFPDNPEKSQLKMNVPLVNLLGNGLLQSQGVKIESDSGSPVVNREQDFRFNPDQQEFDQVQAYFFVNHVVDWFKTNFNIALPFNLNVRVHVTGEDKKPSNTFIYFSGNILLGQGDGVTYRELVRDPTIVMHETAHAYVELLSGLRPDGESGSLNEAFADIFTAYILDTPLMGSYAYIADPFRRNLDNRLTADELNGGKYHDAMIVGGTFWELKNELSMKRATELAILTLTRLGPKGDYADFAPALMDAARNYFSPEEIGKIKSVMTNRKWIEGEAI